MVLKTFSSLGPLVAAIDPVATLREK